MSRGMLLIMWAGARGGDLGAALVEALTAPTTPIVMARLAAGVGGLVIAMLALYEEWR